MLPGKPWTVGETARLRELWQQTHDLNSIAKAMNKSVEAVRNKIKRMGLRDDDQLQRKGSSPRGGVLPADIKILRKWSLPASVEDMASITSKSPWN